MSFVNYVEKTILLKTVLFGPQGTGKTAMLNHVHERTSGPNARQVTLPGAPGDAYYDRLPLMIGDIRGFKTQVDLWTVPGPPDYHDARREILKGVDCVLFVADSRPAFAEANRQSLAELQLSLRHLSFDLDAIPMVLACGHADAPGARSPAEIASDVLRSLADPSAVPVVAVSAVQGKGVFESIKAATKLALVGLKSSQKPGAVRPPEG